MILRMISSRWSARQTDRHAESIFPSRWRAWSRIVATGVESRTAYVVDVARACPPVVGYIDDTIVGFADRLRRRPSPPAPLQRETLS